MDNEDILHHISIVICVLYYNIVLVMCHISYIMLYYSIIKHHNIKDTVQTMQSVAT